MQLRNTNTAWGAVSQSLHWLIVGLIILQYLLAETAEELPLGMAKLAMLARHKSVGMTILGLAVLRLLWRLGNPTPALPQAMGGWERILARVSHAGLYACILAMPVTGWLMSSAKNFSVSWFGWFQFPDLVAPDPGVFDAMHAAHEIIFNCMLGLASLHVLGALKHHFVNRDGVLMRMLPFGRNSQS
jgi:cytochrome b561